MTTVPRTLGRARKALARPGARGLAASLLLVGMAFGVAHVSTASASAVVLEPGMAFPTASSEEQVTGTTAVTGVFDGQMKRYFGLGDGSQDEGQPPIFTIADGGTLKNVIIGSPGGDGVHCMGSCTIENVWWEDVSEDAATLKNKSSVPNQTLTILGGGAREATDKVFQNNAKGGTIIIKDFYAKNVAKFVRSCGNCSNQGDRKIVLDNVLIENLIDVPLGPDSDEPSYVVGLNSNFNDTAEIHGLTVHNINGLPVCRLFEGNTISATPVPVGVGPAAACPYTDADVTIK